MSGAEAVLRGGCKWVQLRMKDALDEEFLAVGRKLAELCRSFGARLILDDRVRLVEEIGADGVHVGKNDMPVDEVRRLLGRGASWALRPTVSKTSPRLPPEVPTI